MAVIKLTGVEKNYGKNTVLKNINLTFEENKIYGVLGRNGAGKTTLMNLITDRLPLNKGSITVDGEETYENDKALSKIYYMTEQNTYPEDFKVKEIFRWTDEFYKDFDMDYALELSRKFELDVEKRIKALSTGYSSVCKIIVTLASGAEVLIFDEPVLGLDANHRELFYKELMKLYVEKPITIILSTHIIGEVSNLMEKVVIVKDGEVVSSEDAEDLIGKAYTVSGACDRVDEFTRGKKVVNTEVIAGFKEATIVGTIEKEEKAKAIESDLSFSKVELQKLFIYLTEKGED